MSYTLKITPTAFSDIQNGIDYYQSQQKGLGAKFADHVQTVLGKIETLPLSASIAYADIRYKKIYKFPYVILYVVKGSTVIILRIFNTHQNPSFEGSEEM